ncbi:MAG: ATP-binding cassette domain-containing protein [Gammaproteobacteria bacterium]|nr:ATP-binding cassette domain-containing protein [Gammaproteobacteria bacterium]
MFALAIFAMIVLAITEPALPALLKPMLDGGFVEKDREMIKLIPVLLILLALIRGLSTLASGVAITWVAGKLVMDLREAMFQKLLSLPTADFDDASSGMLLSKVTYDVSRVMTASTQALVVLVRDSLAVTGLLAWMFYLNWRLSLIVFCIVPLVALVVKIIGKRLRKLNLSIQGSMGDMTRILEEAISGHKLVKVFAGQKYEAKRFARTSNRVRRNEVKIQIAANTSMLVVQLLIATVLAIIIYIASSSADEISVGSFVSLFTAMGMLFAPIKRLTKVNEQIQKGLAAAQSVFELIDRASEPDTSVAAQQEASLKILPDLRSQKEAGKTFSKGETENKKNLGELRFEQLDFAYGENTPKVLKNISLTVSPGETVALVGASGSGKTTIANLIPRFYPLPRGRFLLDGIDSNDLPLAVLRDNIAIVSQDVVLFNDSVAANIAYGSMSGVSREAISAAARAANALEFIEAMPQGLDTVIGERGVKLSGGQRQRIAIARALLKDAPILIFDEATSALDSHSERYVQQSLEKLQQERTTIIIAHRLSTIEKADRIIVMEQGQIAEAGTHQTLLARNGVYAKLYHAQEGT